MKLTQQITKGALLVPFDRLFLDPNNPRLGRRDLPDYADPEGMFDAQVQETVGEMLAKVYDPSNLIDSISQKGWQPTDVLNVWEHPQKPGHYVVVEGNTRTLALRGIRREAAIERGKLETMEANRTRYAASKIAAQRERVERLEQVIADTAQMLVIVVDCQSPAELYKTLAKLLSERHIHPPKAWSPRAANQHHLNSYQLRFQEQYPGEELRWDKKLLEECAESARLSTAKFKMCLQSIMVFNQLLDRYEDRLLEIDEKILDDGHYYVVSVIRNRHTAEKFDFGKQDMSFTDEALEALYLWCFQFPLGDERNVIRKAEDFLLLHKVRIHDLEHGTDLAGKYDIAEPEIAPHMSVTESSYMNARVKRSSVNLLNDYGTLLRRLTAEEFVEECGHMLPMMVEVRDTFSRYIEHAERVQHAA